MGRFYRAGSVSISVSPRRAGINACWANIVGVVDLLPT